jgi:tRNA threonylcarbamoyladenosine biosynthesis protein TsaE
MSDVMRDFSLPDEAAVAALAARFALPMSGGFIHLHGDLGAGKTTFARALLRAMGVGERIKSPTYSLIESYRLPHLAIHHLDLYRIADPGELEWLGLEELSQEASLMLVEWPERGGTALPQPDLLLHFEYADPGRFLQALARSKTGENWLLAVSD